MDGFNLPKTKKKTKFLRFTNKWSRITHLADDPLYLIFANLSKKCDRESFGLTCHRFLDIRRLSCKHLDFGSIPLSNHSSGYSPIFENLFNRYKQLESLSLTKCVKITDLDLTILKIHGSNLRSISLSLCHNVTDIGLILVASGCPLLSVIHLSFCAITDSGLEILTKFCKSLIEVNLAFCASITDVGIRSLNQNCRQLRALRISRCNEVVGVGFEGCSTTLAILEADQCGFSSTGITEILSGGGLEYLNLSWPTKHMSGHEFRTIGSGIAANLKVLELEKCSFITDNDIISISKGCPQLKEWNLSFCVDIGISGWDSIGLFCQNLETLHVNYCLNLCDRGLFSLGKCKNLSVLYMAGCRRKISQFGMESFKTQREDVEIIKEIVMSNFPRWTFT